MLINVENKYCINLMNVEMWEVISDTKVAIHFKSGTTFTFGDMAKEPAQCQFGHGKELVDALRGLLRPQAVVDPKMMSMIRQ